MHIRYAYQGRAVAADGREYSTLLDADTEDVLSITAATVSSNCSATPATSATAIGTPLRPDVATRSIWANSAARLNGFTYEAYAAATPPITVFQEPMTGNSAFWCSPTSGFRYTVFPVALSGGTPIYDDGDPNWKGKTAGDAMYRTRQTMNAFQSMGRSGWDRTNGLAQAVIQSNAVAVANCPDSCASFLRTADIQAGDQVPSGGALVMRPGTALLYNSAAALDQIAHEWGHGVIFTDVPNLISGNPEFGHAMHEGWADVIGQMVEKLTEPVGGTNPAGSTYPAGPEMSRDWDLGEDMVTDSQAFTQSALHYQYAYSGARDDGTAGHSFGNYTINMRLHKNDDPVQPGTPQDHSQGNMLNVVYKILTEGGANPACVRLGTVCNTGSGVGLSSASAIMFDTIQYWVTYNVDWDTLRSAMKAAAFDHFNTCPSYNASAEQLNVRLAFTAIGYSEPFPIHDIQCP